jgi:hypothetical protein
MMIHINIFFCICPPLQTLYKYLTYFDNAKQIRNKIENPIISRVSLVSMKFMNLSLMALFYL